MQQYIKDAYLIFLKCPNDIKALIENDSLETTLPLNIIVELTGSIQDKITRFSDIVIMLIVPYTTIKKKKTKELIDFTDEEINSIIGKFK